MLLQQIENRFLFIISTSFELYVLNMNVYLTIDNKGIEKKE